MNKKAMLKTTGILCILSLIIYGLQIIIFKDPQTTFFYIFQDFAFMPVTIAIATLAVGEIINVKEKKERIEKTRMLTSTFFTEVGATLARTLMEMMEDNELFTQISKSELNSQYSEKELMKMIDEEKIKMHIDKENYQKAKELILSNQTNLLVIASNPTILEHECFAELLWGVFHLIDEFRLRGDFDDLNKGDLGHMTVDFTKVLKLLLKNWIGNAKYLSETYPAFYNAAAIRIK